MKKLLSKFSSLKFTLTIIIISFQIVHCDYISFDLEIYHNNSNNFSNGENFIYSYQNTLFYTNIIFGSPEQKCLMQIIPEGYGFELKDYNCDIQTSFHSTSNPFNIKSFPPSSLIHPSEEEKTFEIEDEMNLSKDKHLKITFNYIPRNYSSSPKDTLMTPYTCFKLGLRLPEEELEFYPDNSLSLLGQFKRQNVINSYEWFIEFLNDSNNARLVMGTSPHEYKPNTYKETNLKKINGIFRNNNFFYWNTQFSEVYVYEKKEARNTFRIKEASLEIGLNVIKGTYEYRKYIIQNLFKELLTEKKCQEEQEIKNRYIAYFCNKNKEVKDYLRQNFKEIYFLHRYLGKNFVLSFDDLFIEKGDKLFFLVIFDTYSISSWTLGRPFLKKYFFSFNYDKKTLSFYDDAIEEGDYKKTNKIKFTQIIVICILVVVVFIIGFYIGKKYFMPKKKENANELLEEDSIIQNKEIN